MPIHPTAVLAEGSKIGSDVQIGPYCFIGPRVVLGNKVILLSHVVVDGDTEIGNETEVYPFATLGILVQDRGLGRDSPHPGKLRIGARNIIRENVTLHPGTPAGRGITTIGDNNFFLVGSHVAHDAQVGNDTVFTNLASIAEHTVIEDRVLLGAMAVVQPFIHVGTLAMLAGGAIASEDIPPYCLAQGDTARLIGLNQVGLRRAGIPRKSYEILRQAFRLLFWGGRPVADAALDVAARFEGDPFVGTQLRFIGQSRQGICATRRRSLTLR